MTNIPNIKCRYIMENKDEYIVSQSEGKWKLHIIDKDNPKGRYVTGNKDIDKIFEKIPECMF